MNAPVAYPVQVLREHITGLEAAVSVCLADPDHKPVHKLRTETRRVEALLLLLGHIPELPRHSKEAAALLRALAKLRRAAGTVRDLDVHRRMLEVFAEAEESIAGVPAAPQNGRGHRTSSAEDVQANSPKRPDRVEGTPENAALLSQAAAELRKELGHDRDKAAAALKDLLKERQAKTAKVAEALLKTLEPAEQFGLPASNLLEDAEAMLTRDGLLTRGKLEKLDEDELHTIRKAAKKARYLAESLPGEPTLAAAAQRFEALQEAGGQWHDALEVAQAARRYFGKGHELTAAYRAQRDEKLREYRTALAGARPATPKAEKRKPAPTKATKTNKAATRKASAKKPSRSVTERPTKRTAVAAA